MENKSKKQISKSALALYVKLYCKKRGSNTKDNKVLNEATKSWLALNKNDKQQFFKKFDEYQNNIKKAFANYLKTAEPYLKVKEPKKVAPDIIKNHTIDTNCDDEIVPHSVQDQNNALNVDSTNTCLSPRNGLPCDASMQFLDNENISNYMPQSNRLCNVEPTPPKFMTGEQLFVMVNNESHLTWTKLNISQKAKYQKAVLTIKRKYLKNYQKYLEQLPPEKLFQHYKKCV